MKMHRWVFGDYVVGAAGERRKVRVDAALGVVEWRPGETMTELLGRADRLMYRQKQSRKAPDRATALPK
jgi:PleD family two-component response regulator